MDMQSFKDFPAHRNIVKYIISNGYSSRLVGINEPQKRKLQQEIAYKSGYDSLQVNFVIECFLYGLNEGYNLPSIQINNRSSKHSTTQIPNHKQRKDNKNKLLKYAALIIGVFFVSAILFFIYSSIENKKVLYRIQENGLYGFIDSDGEVIIEPQYKYVGHFTEDGYACVISSMKLIKNSSDAIIPNDTICIHYGYINKKNKLIIDTLNILSVPTDLLKVDYGIENAEEIISKFNDNKFEFRDSYFGELALRSKRFVFQDSRSKLIGYKDLSGKITIEPKFEYCRSFHNDVAFVLDTIEHSQDMKSFNLTNAVNRYSLIDINGGYIKSKLWCSVQDFGNNGKTWVKLAKVELDEEGQLTSAADCFQIDNKGNTLIGPISVEISASIYNDLSDGLYVYELPSFFDGVKYTFITEDGKIATDYDSDEMIHIWGDSAQSEVFDDVTFFNNGYAGVKIYEKKNNEVIPRWAFINKQMSLLDEQVYDSIVPFGEGLSPVKQATPLRGMGKWGVLDSNLQLVVPFKYSDIGRFNDGLAYAQISGSNIDREGYINRQGEFVWSTNRKK